VATGVSLQSLGQLLPSANLHDEPTKKPLLLGTLFSVPLEPIVSIQAADDDLQTYTSTCGSASLAQCRSQYVWQRDSKIHMSIELQAAAGLVAGLMAGLALGLLRPLLAVAIGLIAVYLAVTLAFEGPPGIIGLIGKFGRSVSAYPIFYSALAAAKAFGCSLVLRR
jgi:hypothetical protein